MHPQGAKVRRDVDGTMIRVLIVEDQALLRESLAKTIDAEPDMETVSQIADAADALEEARLTQPNLILMDVCTENESSGLAAASTLKQQLPHIKIIVLTGMPELTFVAQAQEAQAESFLYKNVGTEELLGVMRSTMEGYSTYPQQIPSSHDGSLQFTELETKILQLVCAAKSRKEIAAELFISEGTVKRHISEILAKTGYDNVLRLAVNLVSEGYIVPGLKNDLNL